MTLHRHGWHGEQEHIPTKRDFRLLGVKWITESSVGGIDCMCAICHFFDHKFDCSRYDFQCLK